MQPKSILLTALSLAAVFCSLQARATVQITNFTGASQPYVNPSQSTAPGATPAPTSGAVTIYGGTAGTVIGGVRQTNPSNGGTFNTCLFAGPGNKLLACNEAAIDGTSNLSITYKADQDGYAYLYDPNTSGYNLFPINPYPVQKGSTATVTFNWGSICQKFAASNGGTGATLDQNCVPSAGSAQRTLALGITSTNGGAPTSSDDTAASITFVFNGDMGQDTSTGESTADTCENNGTGLCHFAIGNGDGKVVLRYLKKGQFFPTGGPLDLAKIRVLWSGPFESETEALNGFSAISANAPSDKRADLTLDRTSGGDPSLSPERVTGLTNDKWYAFKVAVVDLAGNIGYYTATTGLNNAIPDTYCNYYQPNPDSTTCHIGHPGEVVGVLSEPVQCYIATAAYGSSMAPQVETFRQFRNQILMSMEWGARFVKFYYQHSPKYARIIAESESLRALARLTLWPALAFAWLSLHLGLEAAIVAAFATLIAAAFGLTVAIRTVRKFRRRTKCPAAI